jgi:hypothetical protein
VEYIIRGKDVADDWEKANEIKTWLLNRILDADNHYYDIVVNIENFLDILKEAEKTERIEKAIDFLWRMRMEVDNILSNKGEKHD